MPSCHLDPSDIKHAKEKRSQPYSWEQRKLGDVTDIKTGSRNHQDSVENGKYPFFVRSEKIERLDEYDFDTTAILIPGDGRIGEIFHYYDGKFALHQRVYKVDNFNGIDALFLLSLFRYSFRRHALRLNAQGTVPSLRLPMFTKWEILLPKLEEQEKIGQLFQSLDKTITLHEEKQRQLEQLKKALLQKMFADETGYPALRFKGFTAKWEQRKLGEIASMHARIGWQGLKTSEFLETGDYYLITGTDFENGHVNLGKAHYIDKSRYDMDQKLKLKNGDILITKDGTIGKVAYLENLDKPGTLNAGVFIVRPIKKSVYKQYLFQYLAAPFLLKYAKSHSTGGTIQHLNQGIIKNFPVALPSTEEQLVISKFLKYISKTITLHDKKIQYLKQLKRGLLQKMFV